MSLRPVGSASSSLTEVRTISTQSPLSEQIAEALTYGRYDKALELYNQLPDTDKEQLETYIFLLTDAPTYEGKMSFLKTLELMATEPTYLRARARARLKALNQALYWMAHPPSKEEQDAVTARPRHVLSGDICTLVLTHLRKGERSLACVSLVCWEWCLISMRVERPAWVQDILAVGDNLVQYVEGPSLCPELYGQKEVLLTYLKEVGTQLRQGKIEKRVNCLNPFNQLHRTELVVEVSNDFWSVGGAHHLPSRMIYVLLGKADLTCQSQFLDEFGLLMSSKNKVAQGAHAQNQSVIMEGAYGLLNGKHLGPLRSGLLVKSLSRFNYLLIASECSKILIREGHFSRCLAWLSQPGTPPTITPEEHEAFNQTARTATLEALLHEEPLTRVVGIIRRLPQKHVEPLLALLAAIVQESAEIKLKRVSVLSKEIQQLLYAGELECAKEKSDVLVEYLDEDVEKILEKACARSCDIRRLIFAGQYEAAKKRDCALVWLSEGRGPFSLGARADEGKEFRCSHRNGGFNDC